MSLPSAPPAVGRIVRMVPLSCATVAGRPYERRKDIEDKICAVLRRPASEWPVLASQKGTARLPNEVVVYLVSVSQAIDADVFGRLVHELGLRVSRIAVNFMQGFDRDTQDEIIWGVEKDVVELILSDPPCRQGEYLQIAFRDKIEQRTINAVAKRKQGPLPVRYSPSAEPETEEEQESLTDQIADEGPDPEELTALLQDRARRPGLLAAAKAAVKNPLHLEAVILRYAYDWPINDKDPNVPTLARRFGKSPRQIQNWITDTLEAMRAAIGERK